MDTRTFKLEIQECLKSIIKQVASLTFRVLIGVAQIFIFLTNYLFKVRLNLTTSIS